MSKSGAVKDVGREAEKAAAKRERDDELDEVNARFESEFSTLRTQADNERKAVWAKWRERRSES